MLKMVGCAGALFVVVVLSLTLMMGMLMAPLAGMAPRAPQGPVSATLPSVVAAARTLQHHVWGLRANTYDLADPVIQRVHRYWAESCGSGNEEVCWEARSGTLQCVLFVTGAFYLGGDRLPAVGNAVDFWSLYQDRAGWQRVYATAFPPAQRGLPRTGDLMVWRGGAHVEQGRIVEYGHIAIVVAVVPPQGTRPGSVTVAQANAPGNRYPGSGRAGNFYTMPLAPDLGVESWSAYTDAGGMHYGGYTVLGYLRKEAPSPLWMPVGIHASTPYVAEAMHAAEEAQINTVTFLRQIQQESGFDPRARSAVGASGIAQFMPATARALGVDPWSPEEALRAAARLMAHYHHSYSGDDAKALAAYNAGEGAVKQALSRCGELRWLLCLPQETRSYVAAILGP